MWDLVGDVGILRTYGYWFILLSYQDCSRLFRNGYHSSQLISFIQAKRLVIAKCIICVLCMLINIDLLWWYWIWDNLFYKTVSHLEAIFITFVNIMMGGPIENTVNIHKGSPRWVAYKALQPICLWVRSCKRCLKRFSLSAVIAISIGSSDQFVKEQAIVNIDRPTPV